MNAEELTGTYTYRSFLDLPQLLSDDDFIRLKFAQLPLQLSVQPDGTVTGKLIFGQEPRVMDLTGKISAWSPVQLRLTGRGRPGTTIPDFQDYHYEYDGIVLHHWESGIHQRLTIAGTVLRAEAHGSAPAGQTASFLAVKRDA
jgi:hypothetical protein